MRVSLFVTCLSDLFCPDVGESVVTVLRRLGVEVDFPLGQTCCGQPAFNNGYKHQTAPVARRNIELFRDAEYVVMPSGSCGAMFKLEYPHLFDDDPTMRAPAQALAAKTYEFSEFLVNVLGVEDVGARFDGTATYHDSCHLKRGLGIHAEPRRLLRRVAGLNLIEMASSDQCCGFGGTFAVRYPGISSAMVADKVARIQETAADAVVACDTGCLMNMAGLMQRRGLKTRALHLAQVLAGGSRQNER